MMLARANIYSKIPENTLAQNFISPSAGSMKNMLALANFSPEIPKIMLAQANFSPRIPENMLAQILYSVSGVHEKHVGSSQLFV